MRTFLFLLMLLSPQAVDGGQASAADARNRWATLTEDERLQVQENYRRWKSMGVEDQQVMRRRNDTMQQLREELVDSLSDSERARLKILEPDQRRRFLDRQLREMLRAALELLPAEVREELRLRMRDTPQPERQKQLMAVLHAQIRQRFGRYARGLQEAGELSADEERQLSESLENLDPLERFRLMRRYLLRDPDSFGLDQDMVQRLRRAEDPLQIMRLLPELADVEVPTQVVVRYLAEHGIPDAELRRLRRSLLEGKTVEMEQLFQKHEIQSPARIHRWLRRHGVPARMIREVFNRSEGNLRSELRVLRETYDVPPFPPTALDPSKAAARQLKKSGN